MVPKITYEPPNSWPQSWGQEPTQPTFLGYKYLFIFKFVFWSSVPASFYRQQQWMCSQQAVFSTLSSAGGSTLLVMHWDDRSTSCRENIHSCILWRIYMVRVVFVKMFLLAWFMPKTISAFSSRIKVRSVKSCKTLKDSIPTIRNYKSYKLLFWTPTFLN